MHFKTSFFCVEDEQAEPSRSKSTALVLDEVIDVENEEKKEVKVEPQVTKLFELRVVYFPTVYQS